MNTKTQGYLSIVKILHYDELDFLFEEKIQAVAVDSDSCGKRTIIATILATEL